VSNISFYIKRDFYFFAFKYTKVKTFFSQQLITFKKWYLQCYKILLLNTFNSKNKKRKINKCVLFICITNIIYKIIIRNVSWVPNQHMRMISEGSCETEDCSNDAENSALLSQEQITF